MKAILKKYGLLVIVLPLALSALVIISVAIYRRFHFPKTGAVIADTNTFNAEGVELTVQPILTGTQLIITGSQGNKYIIESSTADGKETTWAAGTMILKNAVKIIKN